MLVAAGAERSLRYLDRPAQFRQIQGPIGVGLQKLLKSLHYHCVAVMGATALGGLSATQARDHRVDKSLLQRPSYLGVGQDAGAVLARWPAASCRFDSRARKAGGGLMNCVKKGAINSRPMMAWAAAAKSPKVRDIARQ
jgi:hypothetical protein